MRSGTRKAIESVLLGALASDDPDLETWDKAAAKTIAGQVIEAAFEPWAPVLSVYSATNGRWFNVRFLATGVQVHPGDRFADAPRVEFYDATYANDDRFYRGLGQFTGGRYYVSTLVGEDMNRRDSMGRHYAGLNLEGGEPAWQVDAAAMRLVVDWLCMIWNKPVQAAGQASDRLAAGR